ncbi:MAG TPA: GNAT family N-acetyltransferase [Petrimonas sp.]|uniref:GNAT family N-acetyltransferase n=1 Tax=Petrimonas sp. TaxID=2023866 RepID=UPI00175E247B|nr:GNAT family N-acetyltransferase [Petrimonas sp.]MEA5043808.1 GNAT family N-acetyltransferase [Petrimonas sp.]HHV86697.1 GNAT family N-acetyltransferase [Petrimonas sp.]
MIEIIRANKNHIKDIQDVSDVAWPHTFKEVLSPGQIRYMMDWMYSNESLQEQMDVKDHHYFLAKENDKFLGYMSIQHNCENTGKTKIHKIYILPDMQKRGIGKQLLNTAINEARKQSNTAIYLNVNKYNENAIGFYKKSGFFLVKEEVIDIGNGFVMDDYVFEKEIVYE